MGNNRQHRQETLMKKKNILLIFADQFRTDCIHALGNEVIQTPALDALCRESVVFDRCLTPSPVCVPARYSMMTGQYPCRTGCSNNPHRGHYTGDGMYARLSAMGYYTCGIGKMHFPYETYALHGFDERHTQEELYRGCDDYYNYLLQKGYDRVYDIFGQRSEMYYIPQISQLPASDHPSAWVGDRSVEFIKKYKEDKPFFLMSSFIHPHPPFAPPAPWNKLYRDFLAVKPNLPYNYADLWTCYNIIQNRHKGLSVGVDLHLLSQIINHYYACISFVDFQIGRIVGALKEKGIYEDTLIIFTADHGELLGDFNCFGKRSMLDAACRVPLLVKMPGRAPGRRSDPVSLVDIEPTLLSWAGIEYDKDEFDGVDIFSERHEHVYSQYEKSSGGLFMVASERDKLVYSAYDDKYYYFDSFPETENKYGPKNPRCAELRGLLGDYIEKAFDTADDPAQVREKLDARIESCRRAPYAPAWQDQKTARGREEAAIPEGYRIYLKP